ncbi:hypothetical protein ACE1TI_20360 [Alteribacillus sp. JSM 102045]|uniref:hypothetical protein n=1 Tax=Alteribacillus sp. JSM 102045 TaxID=1562101 RepID=UPI0035C1D443
MRHFLSKSFLYLMTSAFSGALFGFLISLLVNLVMTWMTEFAKLTFLLIIVFLYLLKELGLINIPIPQHKWQIPTSWVNHSPLINMIIWGLILGAGVLTYNFHISLFLPYVYVGLFLHPTNGIWIGLVYGVARPLPSIVLAFIVYKTPEKKRPNVISQIWNKGKSFHFYHKITLTIFFIFLICVMFY